MAIHKLGGNVELYFNQFRVTCDHGMVSVERGAEALDKTTLCQTTRQYIGGLQTCNINGEGFLSYGTDEIEEILSAKLGTTGNVVSVLTEGGDAIGDPAVFCSTLLNDLKPIGGTVGDIHKFTWTAGPSGSPGVQGRLMVPSGNRTTSSNTTAYQLGTVSASQRIYAALHVLSFSGTSPTLDVTVKSDDNSGLSSAVTRLTFTQATGKTAELVSAAGSISDDYWGVYWSIGGSATPTFSFVVSIGIL